MPVKILIVDDSPQIRKSLREILEKLHYEVVGEAGTGIEAISMVKTLSPDIVMLDIIMPQLGGIETLRFLRALDKNLKILMVSALDSLDKVKECMKAGAHHYIIKPFEAEKVKEIVEKIVQQ
ncbi:MAG: response regulator [Nitrospirae bacterium]|nr:response regulator [Nitrospirota bacterium]